MTRNDGTVLKAVLGPTNTGKTHLAIERLCGHSSGMIGFPLRLLAREVYDRVVAIKGHKEVALITGEEKILPPGARWLLCTAEAMPVNRDCAFVAIDEAQLAANPERGHIFTDRLLNVRGREETMILGSDSLSPIVRALTPDAEIVRRPRFSTLSYVGPAKLSRLPKRSAIVAFSAEEVYAVAEMLRRARGGAAVVMGALSPRTRNAQVAMFQSGEVDYIVATDAIGMGLNMDIAHVAFAAVTKFDGKQNRRLTVSEMAQIAGRAGRHQRDGTFGSLGGGDAPKALTPEEVEAIEAHRFPRLDHVFWRNSNLDFASVDALHESLTEKPDHPVLRAAPEAIDLAVLKILADDPAVRDRARTTAQVERLWAACSLPDFRKVGPEHHARTVQRVFRHLSEGNGTIPHTLIADEIGRLDRIDGDIDTLGGRIAAARTWAYVAHRPGWIDDAQHWTARTEALEQKLSDALHQRLTERFVDRRTTVLMRAIGNDPALLDVTIGDDGAVLVESEGIGRLAGFAFTVAPGTRTADRKQLIAAAERHLPRERARRAAALVAARDADFSLGDTQAEILWADVAVAHLRRGRDLLHPRLELDTSLGSLGARDRDTVATRLEDWLRTLLHQQLAPLYAMARTANDLFTPPRVRAVLAPLAANGGQAARGTVESALDGLDREDRRIMRRAGLTIGTLDLYDVRLLRPGPVRLVAILKSVASGTPMRPLPPPGATHVALAYDVPGFRRFGKQLVRIDMVERVARSMHDVRRQKGGVTPGPALDKSFGIDPETVAAILRACGFRVDAHGHWTWRSRPRVRAASAKPVSPAFAALESWSVSD